MGYGNCTIPKCWGDPIAFAGALAKLPRIALGMGIAVVAAIALEGIRRAKPSDDPANPRAGPGRRAPVRVEVRAVGPSDVQSMASASAQPEQVLAELLRFLKS
jgi:hypothetical protein